MTSAFDVSEECAKHLDQTDTLRSYRAHFQRPPDSIYLDGNSLGLASDRALRAVGRRLDEWQTIAVRGWLEAEQPWFYFAERVGALAADLVGAHADEVVLTGTTTLNIHSLVGSFFAPTEHRCKILADELAFPTDIYALRDQLRYAGCDPEGDLVLVPSRDGVTLDEERIIEAMTADVAFVWLPSVLYRSGQLLDMARLTRAAHERGIFIGFDCCHSAGAVPHALHDWDVDCAVWCGYKYLNGGPGCSAFLYLHERHFDRRPGLSGWFGADKERQFDMSLELEHARGAGGWQISSPGILGSATLEGALAIHRAAGMARLRDKSLSLTGYLIFLVDELLSAAPYDVKVATPREPERRGGHVALVRHDAYRISQALRARGVVPDFRPPNIIRCAPIALYNTHHEVWRTISELKSVIDRREYERIDTHRVAVS